MAKKRVKRVTKTAKPTKVPTEKVEVKIVKVELPKDAVVQVIPRPGVTPLVAVHPATRSVVIAPAPKKKEQSWWRWLIDG